MAGQTAIHFTSEVLAVRWHDYDVSPALDLAVEEALPFSPERDPAKRGACCGATVCLRSPSLARPMLKVAEIPFTNACRR